MAVWAVLSELCLSKASSELTAAAAKAYVLSCINQAVGDALEKESRPFASVSHTADGRVGAISVDTEALNAVRTAALSRLEKLLNRRAAAGIPIGSLTEIGILNGRGPRIPVRFQLEGSADISFQTEFESAGIDQSCHRITMKVRVDAHSHSRRFSSSVTEESATVLAETVVVGEVPQMILRTG